MERVPEDCRRRFLSPSDGVPPDPSAPQSLPTTSYTCTRTLFRSLGFQAWLHSPHAPSRSPGLTSAIIPSITSNCIPNMPPFAIARRLPVMGAGFGWMITAFDEWVPRMKRGCEGNIA